MLTDNLIVPEQQMRAFCLENQISKLLLFGSVLRKDFSADSDLDVLVEFHPSARVGLIRFCSIESRLSEILGRQVDLNTPESLSKYFREEVLAEAETRYDPAE